MIREKTLLQVSVAVAAAVPVSAGTAGVLLGVGLVPGSVHNPALDSHFAYLSGLLLAIGLGFWSAVPQIERRLGRIRMLSALVVLGGLARALTACLADAPGPYMEAALVMELGVTPVLGLWAARVAKSQSRTHDGPPTDPRRAR